MSVKSGVEVSVFFGNVFFVLVIFYGLYHGTSP